MICFSARSVKYPVLTNGSLWMNTWSNVKALTLDDALLRQKTSGSHISKIFLDGQTFSNEEFFELVTFRKTFTYRNKINPVKIISHINPIHFYINKAHWYTEWHLRVRSVGEGWEKRIRFGKQKINLIIITIIIS